MTTRGRGRLVRHFGQSGQSGGADNGRGEPGDFDQGYTPVVFAQREGDLVLRCSEEADDQGFRMSFPAIGDFGL